MSTAPSPWLPLRQPLFRAVWLASIVSNIGTTMNDTAAVWTMATMTPSPVMISLMQTMSSLPLFLLALPAGALADVVDRRQQILLAQIGALLTAVGMALLAYFGRLNEALLLLATFQLGTATAFTTPAWQAMIPELVGRPLLTPALALNAVGYNIARAFGPIIGGLLVAALGPVPVFALNAASFVAVIAVMSHRGYTSEPRSAQQEQMLGAITAALRYVRHAPPMQAVLARAGLHVFAAVAPITLLPLLIRERGWAASDFGVLMGCYGAGAIITALVLLPRLRARLSFDRVLTGASVAAAVSTGLLALVPNRLVMGLDLLVVGGGWISALNTFSVASQSAFPNWVRARSSAIYLVVMQGAFALGALAWGRVTGWTNSSTALWCAGGWLLVCAAFDRWLPISHIEKLDLSPSDHWPQIHNLAIEPAPDDGPVLITIDYQIDPAQAREFRVAMRALRRIRLRDGAFRCSLFHDLDNPKHFRETFLVGSWAEHLRQHQRATVEDKRIDEAVNAFHRGPEPPRVRHFLMTNLRD
ncbi:MAG: MFS transporter [Chthoniobacter sp.]